MTEHIPKIDNVMLKEQRRRQLLKRRRIQRAVVSILLLIVVLIVIYMFTPISYIKHVSIEGNHYIADKTIEKQLKIKKDTRIYSYNGGKAEDRINKHPLVKEVNVHKGLFNRITVTVKEYDIVGIVTVKDREVPVIESGRILQDYKGNVPNEVPYLQGFKGTDKQNLVEALNKVDRTTRAQISEVVYAAKKAQPNLIKLYMRDGIEVLGNTKTIAKKLKYYPSMSQALDKDDSGRLKEAGYIDLSVGASFIPYNDSEDSSSDSASAQQVETSTQSRDEAKDELQKALNKIKESEKEAE
ncbi:cell division protein FtsQ/DivIB [Staphylococcus sp. 17KM0847]|uniref:cell division protein FtsQ/DivIB n=1 Tax=Staphylococcus sp. 17KM0847 TaxID=2583989 RepID=UPI0015DC2BA1|nr:FtsQ-type POTRA domain-containing protein [Staphylococcus sp. 17KM0847]QLK85801.1 FtsQ-type POTRA domain-containing protein [Staphylococcus sp. 17KM0847]